MAFLYKKQLKNGHVWMLDYNYRGRRCRKSTGTSNKKEAERILDIIKGRLAMDKFGIPVENTIKLSDFTKEYLEYTKINKSINTYKLYKRILTPFNEFVGNKNLADIKLQDAENYINSLMVFNNKTSLNIKIRTIKSLFNRAITRGLLVRSPVKEMKQYRVMKSGIPEYLEQKQIKRLMELINNDDPEFLPLIQTLLYTGARRNEALHLEWKDINLNNKHIVFHATKTNENRIVPINDKLYNVLSNLVNDKNSKKSAEGKLFNYSPDWVTHKFKKYLKEVGYKGRKSIHLLRHNFGSWLVMSGVGIYETQKLLGHSDVSVTEIYAHLSPDYLKTSIEKLPF